MPRRDSLLIPKRRWWLGWAGSLAALYALILGTGLLFAGTSLHRLDASLFRIVNSLGPGPRVVFDALDADFRNYALIGALTVAVGALARRRTIASVLAPVVLSGLLAWGLLEAIYAAYDRPRPIEVFDPSTIVLAYGHSWAPIESFPSGHLAVTAALVAATARALPRLRLPLWAYLAAIAVTRVLFGAHFPLDVVAGVALGYGSARAVDALLTEAGLVERAASREGEPSVQPRWRRTAAAALVSPGRRRTDCPSRAAR